MKLYKLTKQDGTTHNGYKYGIIDREHVKPPKDNPQLCASDVFHAYKNANLAFLLNPIHANISHPILWEIEGDIVCECYGKVGSFNQKVIKKLNPPTWIGNKSENDVRILFVILCTEAAIHIYGKCNQKDNRPRKAIEAAREYLRIKSAVAVAVADITARASLAAADDVIAPATYVAFAAANTATACVADATNAAYVAYVAARGAGHAARAAQKIDFCKLANNAVNIIMNKNNNG